MYFPPHHGAYCSVVQVPLESFHLLLTHQILATPRDQGPVLDLSLGAVCVCVYPEATSTLQLKGVTPSLGSIYTYELCLSEGLK